MEIAPDSPRSVSSTDSQVALPSFEALAPPRPFLTVPAEETVLEIPDLNTPVRLKVDAGPGCGGIAWPAGEVNIRTSFYKWLSGKGELGLTQVLSRYIAYRQSVDPTYLRDKKILELGSGTGLVGIAAGLLEPTAKIWVTDQIQLVELMRRNIEHNSVQGNVFPAELDWGEDITNVPAEVDIVLAADCVYFEPAFPLLVRTLCDLAPMGSSPEIMFCWKKRRKADKRFFTMLKKHFDSIPVEDDRPGEKERYTKDGVSLIRLKRRR